MSVTGGHSRKKADDRCRVWACVVYPDSAPSDWMDDVARWGVPAVVSPLHDQDKDPDGKPKKPHWHLMVKFEGKKSLEQVQEMVEPLHAAMPIKIMSPEGYTRYLVHKDNPEKAQYSEDGIRAFGGFDVQKYLCNNADKTQTIRDMQEYCRKEGISNFADLMDYAAEHNPSWYTALCTYCSALMVRYLKSVEYRQEQTAKKKMKRLEDDFKAKESDVLRKMEQWEQARRKYIMWKQEKEREGFRFDEKLGEWCKVEK